MTVERGQIAVNVNRQVIDRNSKAIKQGLPGDEPPLRIQRGRSGKPQVGHAVAILDAAGAEVARFIYDPAGALLKCGARLVLLAHHGAEIISPEEPIGGIHA